MQRFWRGARGSVQARADWNCVHNSGFRAAPKAFTIRRIRGASANAVEFCLANRAREVAGEYRLARCTRQVADEFRLARGAREVAHAAEPARPVPGFDGRHHRAGGSRRRQSRRTADRWPRGRSEPGRGRFRNPGCKSSGGSEGRAGAGRAGQLCPTARFTRSTSRAGPDDGGGARSGRCSRD